MKAPDKIYLHPDDRHWWHEGNKTDDRFVEYIRKDALIEWTNSWLAFKKSGIVLDDGFSYAMEELIKILNSM